MTLTEFLTARIEEDEAAARSAMAWRIVPYSCPPDCCAPAGWVGHECLICDAGPTFGGTVDAITEIAKEHDEQIHQRARVLREAEAKRAIVQQAAVATAWDEAVENEWGGTGKPDPGDVILRALAAVYADHADYRDEWRP